MSIHRSRNYADREPLALDTFVEKHRETLEALAESDEPAAPVAIATLQAYEIYE
jgi:hypothetical protein